MGLRGSLQSIVNNAITSSLGDIPSTVTFTSNTTSTYDPETGSVVQNSTTLSCRCVLTSLKQYDVPNMEIVATGRKMLVPTLQLGSTRVDALDDQVVVDGVSYKIFSVSQDPAGALFTFILTAQGTPPLGGN